MILKDKQKIGRALRPVGEQPVVRNMEPRIWPFDRHEKDSISIAEINILCGLCDCEK